MLLNIYRRITIYKTKSVGIGLASRANRTEVDAERLTLAVIATIILAREHVAPCHSALNPLVTRLNDLLPLYTILLSSRSPTT